MTTRKISKEHLIRDYLSLKKKLGRRPVCVEFARHHHSFGTLSAVFGSPGWSSLLKAAGEDGAKLTREHLLNDYFELKRELGRRPTSQEYAKEHHSMATLHAAFEGSGWSKLLKAAGELPRPDAGSRREHFINDYHELKRELGRRPTCLDFAKKHHSITSLRIAFGGPGWTNLLKAAGEDLRDPALFTRDTLIRDYHSLKTKLGRQPTFAEFVKECRCQLMINRIFGKPGWRKLVRAAGDMPLNERDLPADHLIRDFLDLQARLGRRPLAVEYRHQCHSYKVLDRVFGKPGWRNLVKAIGRKALPQLTRRSQRARVHGAHQNQMTNKSLGCTTSPNILLH